MKIDIIIPFYNAKSHIFEIFERNIETIIKDGVFHDFRIIMVNDGSSNHIHLPFVNRLKSKENLDFLFIDSKYNLGKGGAIKKGLMVSDNDYAIFYDIDFPFGMDALYKMYHKLHFEDWDIVISTRDSSYFHKLPVKRKFISFFVKSFAYIISRGSIKDSQAGLKGMRKDFIPLFLSTKSNSFIVDFEFLLKVVKNKLKVDDIIVTPNKEIEFSNFSYSTLKKEMATLLKILISKEK
jgi:glycosyltransferase involved in cell wall biosynthesis